MILWFALPKGKKYKQTKNAKLEKKQSHIKSKSSNGAKAARELKLQKSKS